MSILDFARRAGSKKSIKHLDPAHEAMFETLEQRAMMSLTGVSLSLPLGFYNSTGQLNYEAASGALDISATPTSIFLPTGAKTIVATHGDFQIHARVDSSGNLVRGVNAGDSANIGAVDASGDDFIVRGGIDLDGNGSIDPSTETGVLLTGEIYAFGFQDSGGPTDQYDYRFVVTGGILASYFAGKDLGVTMTSEFSSFDGSFGHDFAGHAKGNYGSIARPPVSSISGYVYSDANNNGVFENTEAPIPGTTVTLTGTNNAGQAVNLTTTTDANGFYAFTNLRPGMYTLTETQPAGYLDGKDSIGTPGGTTANDVFSAISLPAGYNGVNNNFGEILPASLAGFVYYDANNNGAFENTETPIPGTTVTLSGTDDLGNAVTATTTTDANGAYLFDNLRPGTYAIAETQPGGYLDGLDTIGTPGGATANDNFSAINLSAGVNGVNNNFGEVLASSISGFVYYDANNNGVFENTEAPISGTTVTLTGTDDLGNSVTATASTDANGFYSFGNLRPGTYTLTETQPAGYLDGKDTIGTPGGATANDVFSAINLVAGFDGVNNNFGEILASSISGFVYYDANNNGVFENTEAPIPGTTVTLTGTDDLGNSVTATTTTDGTGAYFFGNLRPGTYAITETQPGAYLDGKDTIGTPGGTTANDVFSAISLAAGANGVNNNFGEILASSLSGYVYYDANNNGVFENTEAPIPGTTVTLSGTDDLGNAVTATATTDANGFYAFTNLRPGTYTLYETQPLTYFDGKDTIGTPGGTTANDNFSAINLVAGFNGVNNNFGEILPASISGYVYYDANNDGIFQNTESPIPGTIVSLSGTDDLGNPVNFTTTTDASGYYYFGKLRPGTYTLTETQPAGYLDGKDTIGAPGGNTANDNFSAINLAAGVNGTNNNFGEILSSSLSGFVYYDANNNGVFENTEAPIAGTIVKLTGTDDQGNSVSLTTNTNASGFYSFGNLRPGTYVLTETQPAGYLDGKDTIGTPGGSTANDQFSAIALAAGVNGVNNNFGEVLASSLSGYVYYDANNNGVFENTETPIAGTTVKLTGTDDLGNSVSITTTTNASGYYAFTNLRPGTYVITETQPAGYLDGKDTIGTPGGSTANDQFSAINLAAGVNGTKNNFGEVLAASLSGYVFYDANNNGVFENTESPISGTTVKLTGTDDLGNSVSITTTTNASGYYAFTNLRPGTYVITETQPAGYLDGKDTIGTPGGTTTNDKFSAIVLAAGVNGIKNNFGEILASSLSGYVYYDINNDGVFQNTESPISGTTVKLTGTDDLGASVSITTTTNASGYYAFTNLRPGTYVITESQPAGYVDGKDTIGTPGGTTGNDVFSAIGLAAGVSGVNNNFGELKVGSLAGTKFLDETGNGLTSDDTGFGGVTIYLDANNNGKFDSGEKSTVTAANGTYSFTGLTPGSYIVREVVPTGYIRTGPTTSDNYTVALGSAQNITGLNFANAEMCDKTVLTSYSFLINGTTVVTDLRGNTHQGDEVTVTFTVASWVTSHEFALVTYTSPTSYFDSNNASQQNVDQIASGTFGPGTYSLTVIIPDSYYQIDFICGSVIDHFGPGNSNIFYTAQNRLFSADNSGTNAVVANASKLSGNVYVDLDNDGLFDNNETGLSGVTVILTGTDIYGHAVSITKQTYSDGSFIFGNLVAGTYKITEVQPGNFTDGKDTIGSLGGSVGSDVLSNVVVGANKTGLNYNFGERLMSGCTVATSDTATIGFWQNKNGQALIKSLNGSANATNLGNWLANNYSNLYGSGAGSANNLAGKTNAQVAAAYIAKFSVTGVKLEAQLMALALATYATSTSLAGGSYASSYGFNVSSGGVGSKMFNVGSAGSALGVSNNTSLSLSDILKKANAKASGGTLYAASGDSASRTAVNSLIDSINQLGDLQ